MLIVGRAVAGLGGKLDRAEALRFKLILLDPRCRIVGRNFHPCWRNDSLG